MSSGFRTECPECLSVFRLKDDSAVGKRMKCRKCGHAFRIQPAGDDDFGGSLEEDDYGIGSGASSATMPAPVARRQPRATGKKSKKRTRPDRPFPWKIAAGLVVAGLVVVALMNGGFEAVTSTVSSVADSGLSAAFDSHEALMDESLDNYEELEEALAAVQKEEDIPEALKTLEQIKQRTREYDARLIALGEIDRQRATELTKYWNAGADERKAAFDRAKAQIDRLKNSDLMSEDLRWDLNFFRSMDFDFDLVLELREPDQSKPKEVYFHDRTRTLRRAVVAVSRVKDASSGTAQLEEIRTVTAEIEALTEKTRQPEYRRATTNVSSPYFAPHLAAITTLDKLATKAAEQAAGNEEVLQEIQKLTSSVSDMQFADMGAPGPAGAGRPAAVADGQPEGTGSYPRISTGNPPDGEEQLTRLRDTMAGGDPSAPIVILRASGQGRMPLVPQVGRSFAGRMQGLQQLKSDNYEYAVARITGSLESIASAIRFGKVTGIDPEARLIAIDLSQPPAGSSSTPGGNPVAGSPAGRPAGFPGGRPGGQPGNRSPGAYPGAAAAGSQPGPASTDRRRKAFAEQVGGPQNMVTVNLTGSDENLLRAFMNGAKNARLARRFSGVGNIVFLLWEESPQALADKIDFAEVVSVNEADRTMEIRLP